MQKFLGRSVSSSWNICAGNSAFNCYKLGSSSCLIENKAGINCKVAKVIFVVAIEYVDLHLLKIILFAQNSNITGHFCQIAKYANFWRSPKF